MLLFSPCWLPASKAVKRTQSWQKAASLFSFFFNSSVCTLERDAVAKKDNDTSFIIIKANEEEEEKKNSFFFFLVFLKEPTPLIDAKRIARFFARKVGLNKKLIQKLAIFFHLS